MNRKPSDQNTNKEEKYHHLLITLLTVVVLLVASMAVILVLIFTDASPANASTLAVDSSAVASLEAAGTADVGSVVARMQSYDASVQASVQESQSIESSIEQSIAESEAFAESSIEQAEYDASVAEASREAETALLNAPFAGSHIVPGTVNYNLDDTDIPYIRQLFSNCIVIGNSRAKNAVDCGILTENEVKYQSGTPVNVMTPFCVQNAYLYKPKTLFILGLNDVASYDCNAEQFKADYTSMIRQYLAVNPTSQIYCMESLPIPPEAKSYFYRASTWLPAFNEAIQSMCEENGWTYVSASMYADFSLINSEDHAHYGKAFYFLWAQVIAEQMHLYEDLAGLPYDVNWEPY